MVKKIGKDSVVIITIEQGNQINKKFVVLEDSIKSLKIINDSLKKSFDGEYYKALKYKTEADTFRTWYLENKKIYYKRDELWRADRKHYVGLSLVLMFMVAFFAQL